MKSDYLSLDTAAQVLGVTVRTLRLYIKSGRVTCYKRGIGRKRFIRRDDLIAMVQIVPVKPKSRDQEAE